MDWNGQKKKLKAKGCFAAAPTAWISDGTRFAAGMGAFIAMPCHDKDRSPGIKRPREIKQKQHSHEGKRQIFIKVAGVDGTQHYRDLGRIALFRSAFCTYLFYPFGLDRIHLFC